VTTFRVVRAGPLRVRILELAPVCKHLRGFTFGAHRGSNTLRLPKRITTIGTYLLTGHRGEHTVFMFRARLVRGRHVKLGGGANVCMAQPTETANVTYVVPVASGASGAPQALEPPRQQVSAAKAIGDSPRNWSPLFRAVTLRDGPTPLVYLLLALAAVSFTAAALPPSVVGGQVAARRSQLAAAGIWLLALAAVVITFA
jgi:hypothetical protein